jgi:hypothetical protein
MGCAANHVIQLQTDRQTILLRGWKFSQRCWWRFKSLWSSLRRWLNMSWGFEGLILPSSSGSNSKGSQQCISRWRYCVLRNIGKYLQNRARNGLTLKVKVIQLPKRRKLFTQTQYTIYKDFKFKPLIFDYLFGHDLPNCSYVMVLLLLLLLLSLLSP